MEWTIEMLLEEGRLLSRPRGENLVRSRRAPAGREDRSAVDESVHGQDRLIDEAAWIVPQVEDVALERVGGNFGAERRHSVLQLPRGCVKELWDADIADVAALDMKFD